MTYVTISAADAYWDQEPDGTLVVRLYLDELRLTISQQQARDLGELLSFFAALTPEQAARARERSPED